MEGESFATRQRLEPQMADAELPVSAGLLLVLALGLGRHGDGLAVGDAQLLALDVHVALAVEPFEGDGEMHFAADAQNGLVGFVVPLDGECRVLVAQPLEGGHQLVVVGPGGGPDRDPESRRGELGRRDRHRLALGGQGVAGAGPVQAGNGDEVAGDDGGDRLGGVAGKGLQGVEAFLAAGAGVDEHGVRGERARDHLAQRDFAGVAVGEGLGHREQDVGVGVAGDLRRRGSGHHGDGRGRARGGAELLDQPGQPVHPDAGQPRAAQDGEDGPGGDPSGQAFLELVVVDRLAGQVALHEVVVAHHDPLDQLLVHGVLLVDQLVGDGALVAGGRNGAVDGCVRSRRVVMGRRVPQQVDHAVEVGFGPDRQLDRRHAGTEGGADLGQCAIEVRPFRDPAC